MNFNRFMEISFVALALTACTFEQPSTERTQDSSAHGGQDDPNIGQPMNRSEVRLPASIRITSDTQPNFGIKVFTLTQEQASIVLDA